VTLEEFLLGEELEKCKKLNCVWVYGKACLLEVSMIEFKPPYCWKRQG